MQPTVMTSLPHSSVLVQPDHRCIHSRIVDEARSTDGRKTGRLVCLECLAEFPDPVFQPLL
jgi:hypothetical protein